MSSGSGGEAASGLGGASGGGLVGEVVTWAEQIFVAEIAERKRSSEHRDPEEVPKVV